MRSHRKLELRLPPPALTISDESHKIQKPPSPSPSSKKKPVVTYVVSPEVIHVEASEFMSLVQRLTGPDAPSPPGGGGGDQPSTSSHRDVGRQLQPARVKARVLKRSAGDSAGGHGGGRVLSSEDDHERPAISPTMFFHDLSPPASGVRKDGSMGGSAHGRSWLLHGDHDQYLDKSSDHQRFQSAGSGLSSPFLDIFSQVPDR